MSNDFDIAFLKLLLPSVEIRRNFVMKLPCLDKRHIISNSFDRFNLLKYLSFDFAGQGLYIIGPPNGSATSVTAVSS